MSRFDLLAIATATAEHNAAAHARLSARRAADRRSAEDAARSGMVVCGLCGEPTAPVRCQACQGDPAAIADADGAESPFGHVYEIAAALLPRHPLAPVTPAMLTADTYRVLEDGATWWVVPMQAGHLAHRATSEADLEADLMAAGFVPVPYQPRDWRRAATAVATPPRVSAAPVYAVA